MGILEQVLGCRFTILGEGLHGEEKSNSESSFLGKVFKGDFLGVGEGDPKF